MLVLWRTTPIHRVRIVVMRWRIVISSRPPLRRRLHGMAGMGGMVLVRMDHWMLLVVLQRRIGAHAGAPSRTLATTRARTG